MHAVRQAPQPRTGKGHLHIYIYSNPESLVVCDTYDPVSILTLLPRYFPISSACNVNTLNIWTPNIWIFILWVPMVSGDCSLPRATEWCEVKYLRWPKQLSELKSNLEVLSIVFKFARRNILNFRHAHLPLVSLRLVTLVYFFSSNTGANIVANKVRLFTSLPHNVLIIHGVYWEVFLMLFLFRQGNQVSCGFK